MICKQANVFLDEGRENSSFHLMFVLCNWLSGWTLYPLQISFPVSGRRGINNYHVISCSSPSPSVHDVGLGFVSIT